MKKILIPFACAVLFCACTGSRSSFNSKEFAGKYKMEIAPEALNSSSEANALGAMLGNMLMDDMQVVFYENGDGLLELGPILKYVMTKDGGDGTFTYKIQRDSIIEVKMKGGKSNVEGAHILRKVGDAYDYIKVINPKTNELEMTLIRQESK
ncbi:MAG: hypothetical protein IK117_10540 [Bacteroidales bacterium]|nr:hypothetical protein [Bacteroidales bacterium]